MDIILAQGTAIFQNSMSQYGSHIISGNTHHADALLQQLFEDNLREVSLEKLRLPKQMPTFKLRQILSIVELIEQGKLDEQLIVNKDYMIIDGLKRYYALKRLGRQKVRVCIGCGKSKKTDSLFTIRNH
jgi:hypothetical protein